MGPHYHEMEWKQPLSLGAPGRVEVTGGEERPGANQYHGFPAEQGQHSVLAAYFGLVPWFCFLKRKQNQHRQANGSHAILWFKPQRKECGAWWGGGQECQGGQRAIGPALIARATSPSGKQLQR